MSSYRILMMFENSMIAVLLINILLKRTPENTLNSSFLKIKSTLKTLNT